MNDGFLQQPAQNSMDYADRIERMYPDVFKKIMPYIDSAAQQLGDQYLSEEQLNSLASQIVSVSNIQAAMPYGHNEYTVNDIVRVLLLTTLYNINRDDPPFDPYSYLYPYGIPPYLYPYPLPYPLPFPGRFRQGYGYRPFPGPGRHGGGYHSGRR